MVLVAKLPEAEKSWLRMWIEANRWKEAKTYRTTYPHHYNIRSWHEDRDIEDFDRAVDLIRTFGHIENFHSTVNAYLVLDGRKYWAMDLTGAPLGIINRSEQPDELFGRQWASRTRSDRPATFWDVQATTYDENHPATQEEQEEVAEALRSLCDLRTLNVGCGTGWLLDWSPIPIDRYGGIDPSTAMLNQHVLKHPRHRVRPVTLEEYAASSHPGAPWQLGVCLWGTPVLLSEDELISMQQLCERLFLVDLEPVRVEGATTWHCGKWTVTERGI